MATLPSAPLQYSSLVANTSYNAATLTFPAGESLNMTGLPLSDGTPSNFTVYAWVRWNRAAGQYAGYYDIFTSGNFHLMWTPTGNLFACFASPEQAANIPQPNVPGCTLPDGLKFADGNWHAVAISYEQFQGIVYQGQYPVNQQVGQFWLYVDGDLWGSEIVEYGTVTNSYPTLTPASTLNATLYPKINQSPVEYQNCEIATLTIEDKAYPNDEASILTLWGQSKEGSFVVDFDFANGGATDNSGNNGTAVVSNQQWNIPCLQGHSDVGATNGMVYLPAGTKVNPGGNGDFTVMGWVCFAGTAPGATIGNNTASIALFSNLIDMRFITVSLNYDGTNMTINLGDTGNTNYASNPFPYQLWTFVAVTFDSKTNTYNLYNNGTNVGSGTLTPWWNATASSTSVSIGAMTPISIENPPMETDMFANFQAVSFWSTALAATEIAQLMNGDPTGMNSCEAYFPLTAVFNGMAQTFTGPDNQPVSLTNFSLADTINGAVLTVNSDTSVASVFEMQLPCTAANTGAAFARKTVVAAASADEPRIMTYADHLAHAAKLGIDTKAEPSDEMLADPEFKDLVDWYETLLKDTDHKTAATMRKRFARNLNIGKQLAQKAPGIGSHSFVTKADKVTWTHHTPAGQVSFSEMMASPGTIAMDLFNLILSGSGILMSILGVRASAKALSKGAEKIIPKTKYGTFELSVKNSYSPSKKDAETAREMIMIMIEMGLKVGDLGAAMWAYISDMSWWDMIMTVGGFIVWVASIILTAGGAAFLAFVAKLALLVAAIIAFVKDVVKLINDLSPNSPTPSPAASIA